MYEGVNILLHFFVNHWLNLIDRIWEFTDRMLRLIFLYRENKIGRG